MSLLLLFTFNSCSRKEIKKETTLEVAFNKIKLSNVVYTYKYHSIIPYERRIKKLITRFPDSNRYDFDSFKYGKPQKLNYIKYIQFADQKYYEYFMSKSEEDILILRKGYNFIKYCVDNNIMAISYSREDNYVEIFTNYQDKDGFKYGFIYSYESPEEKTVNRWKNRLNQWRNTKDFMELEKDKWYVYKSKIYSDYEDLQDFIE